MITINRSDLKKATGAAQLSQALFGDRLFIIVALLGALTCSGLLVYMAVDKDRIETVYLDQEKIDVPTLLTKVRSSDQAVDADRWVRGFTRRFLAYYFLSPDDSLDFAKQATAWLHAHTGEAGQLRSMSFAADYEKFDSLRRRKYTSFFAINDPASLVIRPSKESSNTFFVEQPGTFVAKTEAGEAFYDARIKLVVEKVPVSGFPTALGVINVTGLIVKNGAVEFVEDPTKAEEKSRWPLFPPAN